LQDSVEYSNTTVFASNSAFSTTMSVPDTAGNYTTVAMDVESETTSPHISFKVLGVNDPNTIDIIVTEGEVRVVPLSGNHNITGPLATGKTGGNVSFNGGTYHFLVSDDNVAYMDDDSDMNLSSDDTGNAVIANLVEGSKVKLNTTTYTLIHINNDTEVVLTRPVTPVFDSGGSVNVTLLALNTSNVPLNTSITLDHFTDDGTLLERITPTTDDYGIVTTTITVPDDSGVYHLIAGDVGHMSYVVNTVGMFGDILSGEYKPKHTFSQGETLIPVVYLKNAATGVPITGGTVTAKLTCATNASITETLSLTYDIDISAYTYIHTVPPDAVIDTYKVEYTAIVSTQTQKAFTSYDIKAYDLFLKAISQKNDESDGFAPGEEGFVILAGTNLSSGDKLNIEQITSLDLSRFRVNITDRTGTDVTSGWSVMNLSTFVTYMNVPTDVQDEIKQKLGENVTIINFTAPSTNGVYDVLVQVNFTDWAKVRTSICVQEIFVHGEPVNKNGWFSPTVAPDAYARLMIMAFNPKTGEMLDADAIHDAGLVEVWSESASDVVTQYMLNPTLETINLPFMGNVKVLKFQVNDSYLGFHHVKFWVNATVEGTPKTVIGDGWFDEKLYTIRAKPAFDSNTGMFKVFGSGDDIELDVSVKDVSGNNVSSATVEVQSVKYGMTGENVPFTVSTSGSSTTGSDGKVSVTFTPTSSLKSGFYNVRLKMTTQDGVTDYGNGWFEVSNFIFFTYSTSWEAGVNKPINFTLNAFDSVNGNIINKNVSVTLTKIISMGDWEMMTPPSMYNDTDVPIGYINGTGYHNYPAGLSKGGNYEFVFEATDGNSTEVGRAWVHVTPFIAWADTGSNWEHDFAVNDFMNFTVTASKDTWGGGTAHNIMNVTVEKVMQEGMWMTNYRNKSQMAAITTAVDGVGEHQINVSVNTSDWGQGFYSMMLKVADNQSNEVYTEFWFRLQLASVTVPDLMWKTINAGQYHTNMTSINATTDILTKKSQFAGEDIGNVSAGKVSGTILNNNPDDAVTMIVSSGMDQIVDMWNHSQVPYFAMVVVDTVQKTVYIEFENQTDPNNRVQFYNLSNDVTTQVFNASAGDSFTDYTGRTWKITEITADGTVKLKGVNTLKNGLFMNQSVMSQSKSGKFLMGQIWDEEWMNVDLDGDGQYYGDERYHLLMIDANTAGKYDTVYISNTSNFSDKTYKDASADEAITFGGNPIYLLSNKYESGAYNLQFTTYRKGWPGMHLGTYANGTVVKIPFLVLSPDGTTPVSGSKVSIDFLMDESRSEHPLTGVNNTTDANGLAIISINTTQTSIPTGAWMIHYNASIGSEYAVADEEMFWEMPRFELRNFRVSGALGVPGSIDLIQLRDDNTEDGLPGNNMLLGYGDEIEFKRGIGFWWDDNDLYQLEYPFDRWYYNTTNGGFFNYSVDGDPANLVPGSGDLINSSSARTVITYNVTSNNNTGDHIVLHSGNSTPFYDGMWIFNVTDINGTTDTTIAMSYKGWPWTIPSSTDPWADPETQTFYLNDGWWMGGLDFRVITINQTNSTVILELNRPVLVASIDSMSDLMDENPDNGELDKMRGSVNTVNFSGQEYLVYGYEDEANTSRIQVQDGWIETMDRVLVVNATSNEVSQPYRIGEPIPWLDNYYAASVSEWGGKIVLLNTNITQVFPVPQWTDDAPIYYVGTFSDADAGVNIPTLGMCFEPGLDKKMDMNITSDERYSILLFDRLPNGVDYPSEGLYDDDRDLTTLGGWDDQQAWDMYNIESGYGDSLPDGMFDPGEPNLINMSERWLMSVGTGHIERGREISIPTFTINDSAKTATAKTFAAYDDFNKSDNLTILVTAKDFEGTPISGTAELKQLKMMFGCSFITGFFDDLPKTWNMTSAMVNVTLSDGEGLLEMTPAALPAELRSGGSHDFSMGEFTAIVEIDDDSGGTETLKINFFMVDKSAMAVFMDENEGMPVDGGEFE